MWSYLHVRLLLIGGLVGALAWAILASFLRTGPAVAQGGGWSEPLNISNTLGNSRYQEIAADAWGNVHVVWSEDEDGKGWGESIYYTMWDGQTWTEPVDVLYTPPTAHIPAIAADSEGYVHVVWASPDGIRYSHTRINDSPWSAASWSRPQVLSTPAAFFAYWTDVAVDDPGNVHIVWIEQSPQDDFEDLYYSRSTDGGESWSPPLNLSNSPGQSSYEEITIDGDGNPHVIWVELSESTGGGLGDIGVFHCWSDDGGASWSEPEKISRPEAEEGFNSGYPAIFAGRRYVYGVWTERQGAKQSIFSRRWEDDTWSVPTVVVDDAGRGGIIRARGTADSGDGLHLVWETTDAEAASVQYAWSGDGGQTWSPPVTISGGAPPTVPWRADVAVSEGNRLHVVWFGPEEPSDIYYATYQTTAPPEAPLPSVTSFSSPPAATTVEPSPSPIAPVTMFPSPAVITSTQNPTGMQGGVLQSSWFPLVAAIVPVVGLMALVVVVRIRSQRSSW